MSLLGPLVNLPNTVVQKQKYYQNNPNPIYFRGPRAKLYVGSYSALFSVGMAITGLALYNMAAGNKAASD